MKTRRFLVSLWMLTAVLVAVAAAQAQPATSTTIAYQGFLTDTDSVPANGTFSVTFSLYDDDIDGARVWQETQPNVVFTEGVFSVQMGSAESLEGVPFDQPLWLEVSIADSELEPRVPLSAVPYAMSLRGLRVVPAADPTVAGPNVIGGWRDNSVDENVVGATIGGGGGVVGEFSPTSLPNRVTANYGTVSGGFGNTASNVSATVSGGDDNAADGPEATISGGRRNTASGNGATISGGTNNAAPGTNATISGGNSNQATGLTATVGGGFANKTGADRATIGGGYGNQALGVAATVPGGSQNHARGDYSFAAGFSAHAAHDGSFVWSDNSLTFADSLVSTAEHQFLIRAVGGVGIGTNAPLAQLHLQTQDLSLSTGALLNEDLTLEARDAVVGLYSDTADDFGSALSLGQVTGGGLDNKWTLVRLTSNATGDADNSLQFRFGNSADYAANASILELDGDGATRFLQPGRDNTLSLGRATRRWTEVYAVNGTIQTSDRRLKQDITDLGYGLAEVMRLRPVAYRWRDRPEEGVKVGLIAQEVAAVVPEVVHGDAVRGPLGMNYAELVPVLIRALQEQQDRMATLEAEVATLRALVQQAGATAAASR